MSINEEEVMGQSNVLPFGQALIENGLSLQRGKTTTLQVNVGLKCNLSCKHCHVEAGPSRSEEMDESTIDRVIEHVKRCQYSTVDITGGAPEMNPHLAKLIVGIRPHVKKIMVRSNLTLLSRPKYFPLIKLFKGNSVAIVASLPSLNQSQTEAQRGDGVFDNCIATLTELNDVGYGVNGNGLELDIVANPTGAFLAPSQESVEKRFREILSRKWGITFSNLFAFANVPLGRFEKWLVDSGNFTDYYQKLADSFNPCALSGVMCRRQVSVAWDGAMYDCDFHLANRIPMAGVATHISDMNEAPGEGSPIALADYCYTCVAGSGFTCGGAID